MREHGEKGEREIETERAKETSRIVQPLVVLTLRLGDYLEVLAMVRSGYVEHLIKIGVQ